MVKHLNFYRMVEIPYMTLMALLSSLAMIYSQIGIISIDPNGYIG